MGARGRVATTFPSVVPEGDAVDRGEPRPKRLPVAAGLFHGPAELERRHLALAPDDDVELGDVGERVRGGHRRVRPAHHGQDAGKGLSRDPDELEALEPVLGRGRDADDVGPLGADEVADAAPVEPQDVGRDDADVDALLLEDRPDVEEAQGRHRRALGPALGEIAAGRDEEQDLHASALSSSFRSSFTE